MRPVRSRRIAGLVVAGVLLASACAPSDAPPASVPADQRHEHAASREACWPASVPVGALPPAAPIWCQELGAPVRSARAGVNSWLDLFDGGAHNARVSDDYVVFESARAKTSYEYRPSVVYRTQHFLHNGHWMVDVAARGSAPGEYEGDARDVLVGAAFGGALMRPSRSFRFAEGRLVVEVDMAAALSVYRDDAWPEVIVTTAAVPTGIEVDPVHAAGLFGGQWTFSCRLEPSRRPVCALLNDTGRDAFTGGKVLELSATHRAGGVAFGGAPSAPELDRAWRRCGALDPDAKCRDRFRLELEADRILLSVNSVRYMEQAGFAPRLPEALLGRDVYVYFGSWLYRPDAGVVRFHWGRIAVNP